METEGDNSSFPAIEERHNAGSFRRSWVKAHACLQRRIAAVTWQR